VRHLVSMFVVCLAAASVAHADIQKRDLGNVRPSVHWATAPVSTPEIDPAGIFAGMTLLAGGLAVLRGRHS
jgi:hypothetical protein